MLVSYYSYSYIQPEESFLLLPKRKKKKRKKVIETMKIGNYFCNFGFAGCKQAG